MLNNGFPWVVHSDKKTGYHKQTVNYLGRYLKRPPISGSRLMHYAGGKEIDFTYLDHRDQRYKKLTLTQTELIERIISHIPEKHFRMVRYFGFLSNRVCGENLPKVYMESTYLQSDKSIKLRCVRIFGFFLKGLPSSL